MKKGTKKKELQICFMGGRQAGVIGVLTALAKDNNIVAAVSYSDDLKAVLDSFDIAVYETIRDKDFIRSLSNADLLLSIHGREIVKSDMLKLPRFGAVNVHPYLYKYRGADPVGRAFRDGEFKASVGAHIMQERVDEGSVLVEDFVDVSGAGSVPEIYNKLYPHYAAVVSKALDIISNKQGRNGQR